MNRQQAEHILDAYATMIEAALDGEVRSTLREVILDAMTITDYMPITLPITQPWTGKPIVTYTQNTGATGEAHGRVDAVHVGMR